MKKTLTLVFISGVLLISGCGNNQNEETIQKSENKVENKIKKKAGQANVFATQEGLEAKFKEMGLPIYPGAKFEKIKTSNSTFDGGHHIVYNLPEVSAASRDTVKEFYDEIFKKFEENGWKNNFNVWREKGDDQFTFGHIYMENPPMHAIAITYKNKKE